MIQEANSYYMFWRVMNKYWVDGGSREIIIYLFIHSDLCIMQIFSIQKVRNAFLKKEKYNPNTYILELQNSRHNVWV